MAGCKARQLRVERPFPGDPTVWKAHAQPPAVALWAMPKRCYCSRERAGSSQTCFGSIGGLQEGILPTLPLPRTKRQLRVFLRSAGRLPAQDIFRITDRSPDQFDGKEGVSDSGRTLYLQWARALQRFSRQARWQLLALIRSAGRAW